MDPLLYRPSFSGNSSVIWLISRICELVGRIQPAFLQGDRQQMRESCVLSTAALLRVEGISLDVKLQTDLQDGTVSHRMTAEVQQALDIFTLYVQTDARCMESLGEFLAVQARLLRSLDKKETAFRTENLLENSVGFSGSPALLIAGNMSDLLSWCCSREDHPLITACLFLYEFEEIRPFSDGNRAAAWLCMMLILRRWKSFFIFVPVLDYIANRAKEYFEQLETSSTAFVEFLLKAIYVTLRDTPAAANMLGRYSNELDCDLASDPLGSSVECSSYFDFDRVSNPVEDKNDLVQDSNSIDGGFNDPVNEQLTWKKDQVSEPVNIFDPAMRLLHVLGRNAAGVGITPLMQALGKRHRASFRRNHLKPAFEKGWIAFEQPDAPNSPTQKYRLTEAGWKHLKGEDEEEE